MARGKFGRLRRPWRYATVLLLRSRSYSDFVFCCPAAMRSHYHVSNLNDPSLLCQGLLLLQEGALNRGDERMKGRSFESACYFAVFDNDNGRLNKQERIFYGHARVKKNLKQSETCFLGNSTVAEVTRATS